MIAVERYGDGSQEMTFPRGKVSRDSVTDEGRFVNS